MPFRKWHRHRGDRRIHTRRELWPCAYVRSGGYICRGPERRNLQGFAYNPGHGRGHDIRNKGISILTGARGNPVDIEALQDLLIKISDLAMECTSIRELDINPLVLYPSGYIAVDAGSSLISRRAKAPGMRKGQKISSSFYPRSIAILGATDTPENSVIMSSTTCSRIIFRASCIPSSKKDKILGLKTYRSIQDIDAEIDAAIIIVPAQAVSQTIEECCRKGIRYLIVESAGFAETGEAGKNIQARIKELVVANNCRVLGPIVQA